MSMNYYKLRKMSHMHSTFLSLVHLIEKSFCQMWQNNNEPERTKHIGIQSWKHNTSFRHSKTDICIITCLKIAALDHSEVVVIFSEKSKV